MKGSGSRARHVETPHDSASSSSSAAPAVEAEEVFVIISSEFREITDHGHGQFTAEESTVGCLRAIDSTTMETRSRFVSLSATGGYVHATRVRHRVTPLGWGRERIDKEKCAASGPPALEVRRSARSVVIKDAMNPRVES